MCNLLYFSSAFLLIMRYQASMSFTNSSIVSCMASVSNSPVNTHPPKSPLKRMSLSCPSATFLSKLINLLNISTVMGESLGSFTGKSASSKMSYIRCFSAPSIHPIFSLMVAAMAVPIDTPSPCSHVPYPDPFSIACPNVCPRFNVARTPASFSSAWTTSDLFSHDRLMAYRVTAGSRLRSLSMFCSCHSKKGESLMRPYLTTSLRPLFNSRSGRVLRMVVSMKTHWG
mmetsp:Transcript_30971/g.74847  ORF Transcript_30971/g.74847 Transcript_30971/m.74847 type:complete len:228 (+) Transcript_30971:96-779(+)